MASSLQVERLDAFLADGLVINWAESTDSGLRLLLVSLVLRFRLVLRIKQWLVCLSTMISGTVFAWVADCLQWLVGRVITGLAAGQTMAAMPTYFSEVSPPHSRGLMAGAHGSFINIGFALAGWIGWAHSLVRALSYDGRTLLTLSSFGCFFEAHSSFGWRFPNAFLALWGICLLIGSWFGERSLLAF